MFAVVPLDATHPPILMGCQPAPRNSKDVGSSATTERTKPATSSGCGGQRGNIKAGDRSAPSYIQMNDPAKAIANSPMKLAIIMPSVLEYPRGVM